MRNRLFLLGIVLLAGCTALPKSVMPELFINQDLALNPGRGSLCVSIRQERSVQHVFADVDHVRVDLTTANATASKTVLKAALLDASPSVSFAALSPGAATLSITAYDLSSSLGSATATASVVADRITHVPLRLQLN